MKKTHIILIVIILIIALVSVTFYIASKKGLDKLNSLQIGNVDMSKIDDGTYDGSYTVFPVSVELSVVVKEHKITDINIIKHDNGKGKKAETIIDDVIEEQSLEVDTISGATYSSKVILKSIENALSNAK